MTRCVIAYRVGLLTDCTSYGTHRNAPVYISSGDSLKLIDRPDNELNKAEAYKRLGERGAFAMA